MSRARGFSVVLHDVQKGCQTRADAVQQVMVKAPAQCVVAEEPYTHQDGSHIHIFYRVNNPSTFKTQLKYWTQFWKSGRVQVDIMRGSIAQACRYLMEDYHQGNPGYDPAPYFWPTRAIHISPAEYADEWMTWWVAQPPDMLRRYGERYIDQFTAGVHIAEANYNAMMRTPGRVEA